MNKVNDKLTRNSRKICISIKLQADSNMLASPEAGRGNCLPYVLVPLLLSCKSGDKKISGLF